MKLGEVDRRCITIPISTIKRTELLFFECSNRSLNNSLLLLQDKNGYEYKKKKSWLIFEKKDTFEKRMCYCHIASVPAQTEPLATEAYHLHRSQLVLFPFLLVLLLFSGSATRPNPTTPILQTLSTRNF